MNTAVVTYVEFLFPGSFYPETQMVKATGELIPVPERAFGWTISSRQELVSDDETLIGPFQQLGKRTLIGQYYTLEQLKAEFGDSKDHEILIFNIENNYKAACLCRTGNWQPVDDETLVVDWATEVSA